MRKVSSFCPAYLTGIFTIGKRDAAGAGVSLEEGMITEVSEAGKTSVFINQAKKQAKVSFAVIRKYQRLYSFHANVNHICRLPIGFGLGMSAAGALSLSLALNELLGAGLSFSQCVKIAHDSEVECGTGLSGVDAAAIGGFLVRKDLKSKPIKMPLPRTELHIAFFAPIKTSSIVWNPEWTKKVNLAGKKALRNLSQQPSWKNFLAFSKEFAISSGLAHWCAGELEANPAASMAMVGRTIFSEAPLKLLSKPRQIIKVAACEKKAVLLR
ncbi:MAG: hypothetical protein QXT25_04800 [Candidatus Anstonellaceae archaeon]